MDQSTALTNSSRSRPIYAGLIALTIVSGLASRAYPEWIPAALGKYPGDALWAIMAFLVFGLVFPRVPTIRISLYSLSVCFAVETLKLYPSQRLDSVRHTTLGHLVLGHSFTWKNYIAYTIGITIAAVFEYVVGRSKLNE